MRISDWSSDVCSSDLHLHRIALDIGGALERAADAGDDDRVFRALRCFGGHIGRGGIICAGGLSPGRRARHERKHRYRRRQTCLLAHMSSPEVPDPAFLPLRRWEEGEGATPEAVALSAAPLASHP